MHTFETNEITSSNPLIHQLVTRYHDQIISDIDRILKNNSDVGSLWINDIIPGRTLVETVDNEYFFSKDAFKAGLIESHELFTEMIKELRKISTTEKIQFDKLIKNSLDDIKNVQLPVYFSLLFDKLRTISSSLIDTCEEHQRLLLEYSPESRANNHEMQLSRRTCYFLSNTVYDQLNQQLDQYQPNFLQVVKDWEKLFYAHLTTLKGTTISLPKDIKSVFYPVFQNIELELRTIIGAFLDIYNSLQYQLTTATNLIYLLFKYLTVFFDYMRSSCEKHEFLYLTDIKTISDTLEELEFEYLNFKEKVNSFLQPSTSLSIDINTITIQQLVEWPQAAEEAAAEDHLVLSVSSLTM